MIRCAWAETSPLMMAYHDTEWGVPLHDDRRLFEAIILDGAQAGLSWETILKKRENYRRAFHDFDAAKMARYTQKDMRRLLSDPGIVRNRLKITSAIKNAQGFLEIQEECGSFDRYLWQFVNGRTITNRFRTMKEIPAKTEESEAMSKDLKKRGFSFVGPTICYAMMQAAGMVNDHTTSCFRYRQFKKQD
jgi:DNA-3-methyladenine glycosylase I